MSGLLPPKLRSLLSQPFISDNFLPMQSASLTVGTANSSSVTFTVSPNANRVTFKFFNSGTKDCFVGVGAGSATAIVATSTPNPSTGTLVVSNCDCIPHGAILTQDYPGSVDTVAAICANTDTTTLQISIGGGQ